MFGAIWPRPGIALKVQEQSAKQGMPMGPTSRLDGSREAIPGCQFGFKHFGELFAGLLRVQGGCCVSHDPISFNNL